MDTLQLDLAVVLPNAHDARDRCVDDLMTALGRLDGVDSVHVIDPDDTGQARVCLHLQSGAVSLARLEDLVRSAGAEVDSKYGHLIVETSSAGHSTRAWALSQRLQTIPGVVDGAVSIEGVVRIEYDRETTAEALIVAELPGVGIRLVGRGGSDGVVEPSDSRDDHGHESEHEAGDGHEHGHGASRVELSAAIVALLVYLVARSLDWFTDIDGPVTLLYMVSVAFTGVFVARDAWLSLKARVFDIDQLMLVAAVGAASIGHWSDSALLLVLFSLGHAQ